MSWIEMDGCIWASATSKLRARRCWRRSARWPGPARAYPARSWTTPSAWKTALQRYVSARLNRFEIESLRNDYRQYSFKRLWRDAGKRTLLNQSRSVVQADAAQNAYRAVGKPHRLGGAGYRHPCRASRTFNQAGKPATVEAQWDCTHRGTCRGRN